MQPHTPFAALNVMFPNQKTHQMERQGQHQEKYPQIEVAGVVEFVLIRVVVPAPGQGCPDSLTQGLHNLGAHLSSCLLLSTQVGRMDDAAAARLQWNDLLYCMLLSLRLHVGAIQHVSWALSFMPHRFSSVSSSRLPFPIPMSIRPLLLPPSSSCPVRLSPSPSPR